jgi:hypothetical protein
VRARWIEGNEQKTYEGSDFVAGFGRAGDGAVGAAFGDARLAAKSRTRTSGSWAMRGARARPARKVPFDTIKHVTKF